MAFYSSLTHFQLKSGIFHKSWKESVQPPDTSKRKYKYISPCLYAPLSLLNTFFELTYQFLKVLATLLSVSVIELKAN